MGTTISFYGRRKKKGLLSATPSSEDLLIGAEEFVKNNLADLLSSIYRNPDVDGHPALFFQLHPAAEDVELSSPYRGRLHLLAKTSTVGPGSHVSLCELANKLASHLNVIWEKESEDEGNYFHSGDISLLQREMLSWLQLVSTKILEMVDAVAARQTGLPADGPQ